MTDDKHPVTGERLLDACDVCGKNIFGTPGARQEDHDYHPDFCSDHDPEEDA